MSEYKNSIQIGVKIDPKNQAQADLNKILETLNKNKINLDLTIQGDAKKQLENLSVIIDTIKSKMGGEISLGNLDKAINNSISGLTKLNGEIQKVTQTNYNDGSKKVITQTATAIGEIINQTQRLAKDGTPIGDGVAKTTKNYLEQAKAIEDIAKAQEKLNNLKLANQNEVSSLKGVLSNISANEGKGYSTNELNGYLNKVRELETEENRLKQIQKEELDLINQMANAREKAEINSKNTNKLEELAQTKAINQALEENYRNTLKEVEAQKQVQQEIQKQVKLLEIQKSSLNRQYGNKIDTSYIDNAITKLKSMDNVDMRTLKSEISSIGLEIKSMTEQARSSEGILGRLGNSLRNIGIYFDAGDIFRGFINTAKDAVNYVIKIEDSMVSLKRVVDGISGEGFKNLQNDLHNMAVETASSTSDMIETVTSWKKLGYDLQQAQGLAEQSTKFNTAGDINNMKETTKDMISILRGFGIANDDAVKKSKEVGDAINQLSNNFAVTSQDLADSMQRSSSALKLAGNSINQSLSLATVSQEVNQNSEKVGTGLKTISMRLRGVSTDGEVLDAKLGKLVKTTTGVDMTMNGAFRSTYDILHDIAQVWNTGKLDDMTKANLAEKLFGKNQATVGIAILENFKQLDATMKSLENSSGSVEKEFARSMDSTSAKIRQLKENVGGIFSQFVNSDMTKGVVGGLNSLAIGVGNIIKTFGALPTTIMTVVTALGLFNTKIRESLTSYQPTFMTNWINGLNNVKNSMKNTTNAIKEKIVATKSDIIATQQSGSSAVGLQAKLLGLQTSLAMTTAGTVACTVATEVMQAVMTLGLSAIITGVITGVTALGSALFNTGNLMQESSEKAQTLSSSLNNIKGENDMISQLESLNKQLDNTIISEQTRKELNEKIATIKNQLANSESDYAGILSDENLTLAQQLDKIKQIQKQKLFDQAKDLDDSMPSQSKIEKEAKDLNEMTQNYNNLKQAIASGNTNMLMDKLGTDNIQEANEMLKEVKNNITSKQNDITKYNANLNLMKQADFETSRSSIELSNSVKIFNDSIKESTDSVNQNTTAKEKNNQVLSTEEQQAQAEQKKAQAVKQATEEYQKSTQAIAKAQGFIDKLNKSQAVTPQLAGQISKTYGDITTQINSYGSTIDFLKGKIQEQQEAQQNSLMVLKGDDADFYQQKIANNENYENQINDFLARFNSNSQNAYDVDLSQFTTLNQMKAGVQGNLKSAVDSFLSQFVDTSAEGYKVDYNNFTNLMSAKAELLKQMAGSMAQFWDDTAQAFNGQAFGGVDLSGHASDSTYQAYQQKAQGILDLGTKIKGAMGKLDGIYAGGGLNFQGFGGSGDGGVSDFSGTGGSGGKSKAESEAEKAQKMAEDIQRLKSEIEPDRYLDFNNAVKQVDNELNLNKTLKDTLKKDSPEYQSALEKDIKLYGDKKNALDALNNEQKKEQAELKTKLASLGFEFDANNKLINSQKTLLDMQEKVNAMGGNTEEDKQAKQDAIKNLKDINDETKKYIELVGDKIPKTTEEWEEQANAIAKVKDEMKESLNNFREKIAGYELEELQSQKKKEEEDLESAEKKKKKALEDAKKAKADELEAQIKFLQDQIKALDDESADNEKKLAKLKAEKSAWMRDDSVFAKSKIADLDEKIKETEKTIKKDNLNKQIDKLQDEKDKSDKEYDKKLSDLDDYYEKKKEKQKKSDDDAKLEEKAYEKADKLLKSNNQKEILDLMSKYGKSYKDVGTLLGQNFKEGWIAQIEQAKKEYTDLMGSLTGSGVSTNSTTSSNNTSSSSTDDGSGVKTYTGTTSTGKSYTINSDGVITNISEPLYEYEEEEAKKHIPRFKTGGRTGDLGADGKFVIADSNEMIANADDTKKFDEMYNYIKNSGSLIGQLSNTYANPNSYSLPNLVGNNLNGIANNVTNTNSNSTTTNSITMPVTIVNEKGAEQFTEQKLYKAMDKWQREQGRRYK